MHTRKNIMFHQKKAPAAMHTRKKNVIYKKARPKTELHTEGQKFNYIRAHMIKSLALASLNI